MAVTRQTPARQEALSDYEMDKVYIESLVFDYNKGRDKMMCPPPSLKGIKSAIISLVVDEQDIYGPSHILYLDGVRQKTETHNKTWAVALLLFEDSMSSFSPIESLYNTVLEMRWDEEPTKFWLDENGKIKSLSIVDAFLDNMKELSYKDTSNLGEQILVHMEII